MAEVRAASENAGAKKNFSVSAKRGSMRCFSSLFYLNDERKISHRLLMTLWPDLLWIWSLTSQPLLVIAELHNVTSTELNIFLPFLMVSNIRICLLLTIIRSLISTKLSRSPPLTKVTQSLHVLLLTLAKIGLSEALILSAIALRCYSRS